MPKKDNSNLAIKPRVNKFQTMHNSVRNQPDDYGEYDRLSETDKEYYAEDAYIGGAKNTNTETAHAGDEKDEITISGVWAMICEYKSYIIGIFVVVIICLTLYYLHKSGTIALPEFIIAPVKEPDTNKQPSPPANLTPPQPPAQQQTATTALPAQQPLPAQSPQQIQLPQYVVPKHITQNQQQSKPSQRQTQPQVVAATSMEDIDQQMKNMESALPPKKSDQDIISASSQNTTGELEIFHENDAPNSASYAQSSTFGDELVV